MILSFGLILFVVAVYLLFSWYLYGFPFSITRTIFSISFYKGKTPFTLMPESKFPVLSKELIGSDAWFIADPFVLMENFQYYLFFEIFSKKRIGTIGCASSNDLIKWDFLGEVLKEEHHLSYPFVFRFDNTFYLMPEASQSGKLELYKASNFPLEWKAVKTLLEIPLLDSSLLFFKGVWYIFASLNNCSLSLYYSEDLIKGNFKEHPLSPVIKDNCDHSRPAGRPFIFEGIPYRLAQSVIPNYGNKVTVFKIGKLSKTEYAEEKTDFMPNLRASGRGWNASGMHHVDVFKEPGGEYIAAVDGHTPVRFWGIQFQRLLFVNKFVKE